MNTVTSMKLPNWQHHSKKEKKRHLKPQALRAAKKRLQALRKNWECGGIGRRTRLKICWACARESSSLSTPTVGGIQKISI